MDMKIYGFYANIGMLGQKEVFRRLFCGLSRERQQKTERIRNGKEKERSLLAGALLDFGLWRLYGLRERDVAISYGAQGKPYLRDYPDIQFNLSHSGDYALAVFAPAAVGCDIQQKGQAKKQERIAARFFAEEERRAMEDGADFDYIWARKESFLKLTGAGMSFDMRAFCVTGESCVVYGKDLPDEACAVCGKAPADMRCLADGTDTVRQKRRDACTGLPGGCADVSAGFYRFADFRLPGYCLSACYANAEPLPAVWAETTEEALPEMDSKGLDARGK